MPEPLPNLLRADVVQDGRERSDPAATAHPDIVCDGSAHSDLATAFKVDRPDEQALAGPSRRLDVGAGLDSDIVLDDNQVQWPRQIRVRRALKISAYLGAELPQRECQERRAAVDGAHWQEHEVLHSSDAPDPQVHLAPLGVGSRCQIVAIDITAKEKLDAHDPEQTGEGQQQAEQVHANAGEDKSPYAGRGKEGSYFDGAQDLERRQQERRIKESRKEDLQDREASDRQYFCRTLIACGAGLPGCRGGSCRRDGRRTRRIRSLPCVRYCSR